MTKPLPKERTGILEAIEIVKKIGDDSKKNEKLFSRYVDKIKQKLKEDKTSIGISDEIDEVRKVLIPPKLTKSDPDIELFQETYDLTKKIEEFMAESTQNKNPNSVFLLLGNAGSGKSVNLQIEFIKAIETWNEKKPLPIYFNLSNGIDMLQVLQNLDLQLNTTLYDLLIADKNTTKNLELYVDSFDEGIYKDNNEKINLIKGYFENFKSNDYNSIKIILSCRTSYLKKDASNYEEYKNWFQRDNSKFTQYYIAPINYKANGSHQVEDLLKIYFQNSGSHEISKVEEKRKRYLARINQSNIEQYLTTGFIFRMLMQIYEKMDQDQSENPKEIIDITDIYQEYTNLFINSSLSDPKIAEKIEVISKKWLGSKFIEADSMRSNLKDLMLEIGIHIATVLHIEEKFRIKNHLEADKIKFLDGDFFTLLNYNEDSKIGLKNQEFYYIIKNLPLKIEAKKRNQSQKNNEKSEDIAVGFVHDTIKNYFLFEGLKKEASLMKNPKESSKILGCRLLKGDLELFRFIARGMKQNSDTYSLLTNYLREQIERTKSIKKDKSINISSTNSISLLVAAGYSFAGQDLSNTIIQDADLTNGILSNVNFEGAMMMNSTFKNSNLSDSKFVNNNLTGANFSTRPTIKDGRIYGFAYSPDGKHIATGNYDYVKIWDALTCQELHRLEGFSDESIDFISYSHDGRHIATCSNYSVIKIWDALSYKEMYTKDKRPDGVNQEMVDNSNVSFSPDGKFFASGIYDMTCKIWHVSSGEEHLTLKGHTHLLTVVEYSKDGKYIATGSSDCTCKLWDPVSGKELKTLQGHSEKIKCLSFSTDGTHLVTGSTDKTCKIWDPISGQELQTFNGNIGGISDVTFLPNSYSLVASSDRNICKLWDASSGKEIKVLAGGSFRPNKFNFSPDGKYLAVSTGERLHQILNHSDAEELGLMQGHTNGVYFLEYSTDGKKLATSSEDKTCKIWDSISGRELKTLRGHSDLVSCIVFSPDGKYLATGSEDKTCKIWDALTAAEIKTLEHKGKLNQIKFSPDGSALAICFGEECIISEIHSGKVLRRIVGETFLVYVTYSPNGRFFVTCENNFCKIWDASSGEEVQKIEDELSSKLNQKEKYLNKYEDDDRERDRDGFRDHSVTLFCVEYSPDSEQFVCLLQRECLVFDGENFEVIHRFKLPIPMVRAAYSPKTKKFLVLGHQFDGGCTIFDANSYLELQVLKGYSSILTSISFSPDSNYFAVSYLSSECQIFTSLDANLNSKNSISKAEDKGKIISNFRIYREIKLTSTELDVNGASFKNCEIDETLCMILKKRGADIIEKNNKLIKDKDVDSKTKESNETRISESEIKKLVSNQWMQFKNLIKEKRGEVSTVISLLELTLDK